MDLNLALNFSTQTCRSVVCRHNGIDFSKTPELYNDTYVRGALPRTFMNLLGNYLGRDTTVASQEMVTDLFSALEALGTLEIATRNRCIQIISKSRLEFISRDFDGFRYLFLSVSNRALQHFEANKIIQFSA